MLKEKPVSFAYASGRPPGNPGKTKENNGNPDKGKGLSFEFEAGRPPGNPGEPEVRAVVLSGRAASDRTSAAWS